MKWSILIIGTGSLQNYGCEAIVQGTYKILKTLWPDCNITIASDDLEYDRRVLPEDVKLVGYRRRFTPYRIFKGILRRIFHIGSGSAVRMNTNIGRNYDLILSCGGDNYCEKPDDFGIYDLLEDLMSVGAKAVKARKRYYLWGASVGPFHRPEIEKQVIDNLSLTSALFVREDLSEMYLQKFPALKDKTYLIADPAFQMDPILYPFKKENDKLYVGINMSELAVGHSLKNEGQRNCSKKFFAEILDSYLENNQNVILVFIPHVNQEGAQNDMNFLRPVYDFMKQKDKIVLIKPGLGARKTKGLLANLDLLVAARMHCCVGGISVATPTLFVTYSNKGRGMSYYAYGNHNYEIECADIFNNSEIFSRLLRFMLDNRENIKRHLNERQPRFLTDSMLAGETLVKTVQ